MDDQGANRESGGMRFRKLLIAWSVFWGLACVLLIVLWVWSYRTIYKVQFVMTGSRALVFITTPGPVHLGYTRSPNPIASSIQTSRLTEIERKAVQRSPWHISLRGNYKEVRVPHWLAIVACGATAMIPWLRRRFSLRTLLIAMTLVAAMLGFVVWAAK
jgi:hypothetical protein